MAARSRKINDVRFRITEYSRWPLCPFSFEASLKTWRFIRNSELSDLVPLHSTTTVVDIFENVKELFTEFELDWGKLASVSTDGACAMLGKKNGCQGRLQRHLAKLRLPSIPFVHCVIHRENLCAKSLSISINQIMKVLVKVVNFIRVRDLNHRQFWSLLEDLSSDYDDIPFYCEV